MCNYILSLELIKIIKGGEIKWMQGLDLILISGLSS